MNPSNHPESGKQSDADDTGEDFVESFVRKLRDGGPQVAPDIILAFIEKRLPSQEMSIVKARINTWKPWHDVYVVLFHDSLDESKADQSIASSLVPDNVRERIRSLIEKQTNE